MSHLNKRAKPTFIGFTEADEKTTVKIMQGFEDAITMVQAILSTAGTAKFNTIFPHYFSPTTVIPVSLGLVRKVFTEMDDANRDGRIGQISVNKEDFGKRCRAKDSKATGVTMAYIQSMNGMPTMHFCDEGVELPAFGSLSCATVGPAVGKTMSSLASVIIYEWTQVASSITGF